MTIERVSLSVQKTECHSVLKVSITMNNAAVAPYSIFPPSCSFSTCQKHGFVFSSCAWYTHNLAWIWEYTPCFFIYKTEKFNFLPQKTECLFGNMFTSIKKNLKIYMLMFWSFYIQKELSVAFLHGMHVLLEVRNSNYKLETQNVSWELLYIFKDGLIYFLTWTGIGIKMLIFNFGLFSAESL